MTHRQVIKEWLAGISLKNKKVIDWGSGSKPAFRYIQHEDCMFTTVDDASGIPRDRQGEFHYKLDITEQTPGGEYQVAFCLEVLEHLEWPEEALKNIYSSLEPNGKLYMSAPFKYEIHAEADYWRFTENGLRLLLERNGFIIDSIKDTVDELGYMVEAHK